MKIVLFILSVFICQGGTAQAKELNELFKKYTHDESRWRNYTPVALQHSKKFIILNMGKWHPVGVMQWKNMDSARIFSYKTGPVLMVLYGKVVRYRKCESYDRGCVTYLGWSCIPHYTDDKAIISLNLTPGDTASNNIRKRFTELISALNHIPVPDTTYPYDLCFDCKESQPKRPVDPRPAIIYNDTTHEIIYSFDSVDHTGPFHLQAEKIREAKKLRLVGFVTQAGDTFTFSATNVYIVRSGAAFHVKNEGQVFNEELLRLIQSMEPGDSFILDQVQVNGTDGSMRTIQLPGFKVE